MAIRIGYVMLRRSVKLDVAFAGFVSFQRELRSIGSVFAAKKACSWDKKLRRAGAAVDAVEFSGKL